MDEIKQKIPSSEEYNLEDDDVYPLDSGDNSNNDSGHDPEDEDQGPGFGHIWSIFFRILLSPVEGWKALKRLHLSPEKCNSTLLFPSIALAAAVIFVTDTYFQDQPIQKSLPIALENFCGFFFGYFCVLILGKILLSKETRGAFDTSFGKNFVAVGMTSLALFDVLYEAFPMVQPVLVFLPLWTIFILSRGCRLLGIPQDGRIQTTTIISVLTIGLPIAIRWILGILFSSNF